MPPSSYIQQSIEYLQAIDTALLETKRVEAVIGRGSSARVLALGSVGLTPLCVKVLSGSHRPATRLQIELRSAAIITHRAPELQSIFPAFIGLVAIKDFDESIAIITEDASLRGTRSVKPMSASAATKDALYRGFPEEGARGLIRPEELENSVAFSVDGKERWLDLTPSPINLHPARGTKIRDEFENVGVEIDNIITDLTCFISPDSTLAQSIGQFI